MDADKLLSSISDDFIFDDPAELQPATKQTLVTYIANWQRRTSAAASTNEWIISDEIREDKNGILADRKWKELFDTDLCGSALIKTTDKGVFISKLLTLIVAKASPNFSPGFRILDQLIDTGEAIIH